ncbi:MFS transporter [Candidatus Woesearchaeota archaeon]|nr:MFS transporter [Candidatus Woesearchaeota archaeon]
MFFKKGEFKLLWPFYLSLFIGFLADSTEFIWVIFFLDKGFSFVQISLTWGIVLLGTTLFEIPTGAVADILGRKKSVIIGWLLGGLILLMVPFMQSFVAVCLLLIFFAFALTLVSGAEEAWVVDLLKRHRQSDLQESYFMNSTSIKSLGTFIAGVLGVLIIAFLGIDWIFFISGAGMTLGGFCLMFAERSRAKFERTPLTNVLGKTIKVSREAIKYVYDHKILFYLTLGGFFFYLISVSAVAWQPYFLSQGILLKYFTLLGSAGALIGVFVPHLVKVIQKKIKGDNQILALLIIIIAVASIGIYFIAGPVYAIIAFIVSRFVIPNILFPLENHYFQKHSLSKIRAAIGSTKSMIIGLPCFIAMLAGGFITDAFGPKIALALSGVFILPGVIFYYLAKK